MLGDHQATENSVCLYSYAYLVYSWDTMTNRSAEVALADSKISLCRRVLRRFHLLAASISIFAILSNLPFFPYLWPWVASMVKNSIFVEKCEFVASIWNLTLNLIMFWMNYWISVSRWYNFSFLFENLFMNFWQQVSWLRRIFCCGLFQSCRRSSRCWPFWWLNFE